MQNVWGYSIRNDAIDSLRSEEDAIYLIEKYKNQDMIYFVAELTTEPVPHESCYFCRHSFGDHIIRTAPVVVDGRTKYQPVGFDCPIKH